jgi:hypothetical protein
MCASERLAGELCTGTYWDPGIALVLMFPLATPYMSIYHGTTMGLFFATTALLVYAAGVFVAAKVRNVA